MHLDAGLILSAAIAIVSAASDDPLVKIKQGSLRGTTDTSASGKRFFSFSGIPFAEPPTGERRFKLPEAAGTWKGVRDASAAQIECPQIDVLDGFKLKGVEDCLYLNVYTNNLPSTNDGTLKPVMVFIHGGGFTLGSNQPTFYGPKYLVERDVVLVVMNYRLGALGFLATGDDLIPGNMGLWDQRLALRWVQENIKAFGGDPEQVTIFGESAGGMSVMMHVLSPESSGLFQRAIPMSGPALTTYLRTDKHPAYYTRSVADAVGCNPEDNIPELVKCLKTIDVSTLVTESNSLFEYWGLSPHPYQPRVDDYATKPFLPKEPLDLIEKGEFNHVPLIIGSNLDEGVLFAAMQKDLQFAHDHWDKVGPLLLCGREPDEIQEEDVSIVRRSVQKFFNGVIPGPSTPIKDFFQMQGDSLGVMSAMTARRMAERSREPVYNYVYTHVGSVTFYDVLTMKPWQFVVKALAQKLGLNVFSSRLGAGHADELLMLFSTDIPFDAVETEEDAAVRENLLRIFTDFAKTGEPGDTKWERVGGMEEERFMNISHRPAMTKDELHEERVKFWEAVWAETPPHLHRKTSETWNDPKLYKRKLGERKKDKTEL